MHVLLVCCVDVSFSFIFMNCCLNRSFSYSRFWTGTSLQLRLMRGVFSNANDINPFLMIFPRMSLHCKLVPVHYREYEIGLLFVVTHCPIGSYIGIGQTTFTSSLYFGILWCQYVVVVVVVFTLEFTCIRLTSWLTWVL